jgi:nitrogenase-associated protein
MATVVFWEKPGCAGNARQKQVLRAAGHEVVTRDLLREAWTAEALRAFFGALPPSQWFNRNAPAVKSGFIVPERLSEAEALAATLAEPLLIRRPLLRVGDRRVAGFNSIEVDAWIGLGFAEDFVGREEVCVREGLKDPHPCPLPEGEGIGLLPGPLPEGEGDCLRLGFLPQGEGGGWA